MSKYSCCGDVPYESLVKFMQKMSEVPANKKDRYIQQFMQMCVPRYTPDIFQIFRLLLPLVSGASLFEPRTGTVAAAASSNQRCRCPSVLLAAQNQGSRFHLLHYVCVHALKALLAANEGNQQQSQHCRAAQVSSNLAPSRAALSDVSS